METPKDIVPIKAFRTPFAWATWMAKNHGKSDGIWLKVFKKDSDIPSITCPEALDICLCYGWIDGQRKGLDAKAFLQKYTPRRKNSLWSKINRDKALLLIREKRMQPAGLAAVETAKKNGRWKTAYAGQKSITVPVDLQKAFKKNPKAAEFFKTLKSQNRYAILFRVQTCRNAATRVKKVQTFIDMLNAGKTLYPEKPSSS